MLLLSVDMSFDSFFFAFHLINVNKIFQNEAFQWIEYSEKNNKLPKNTCLPRKNFKLKTKEKILNIIGKIGIYELKNE